MATMRAPHYDNGEAGNGMSKIASAKTGQLRSERAVTGIGAPRPDSSTGPEAGDGTHWSGRLAPGPNERHTVSRLGHMLVQRWLEEPVEELTPSIGRQVVNTETMTIARIHLRAGAGVPRHAHPQEQVANVLEGRLRFVVGDDEHVVSAGESVIVPAGVSHGRGARRLARARRLLAVRDDWIRGEDAYLRG